MIPHRADTKTHPPCRKHGNRHAPRPPYRENEVKGDETTEPGGYGMTTRRDKHDAPGGTENDG